MRCLVTGGAGFIGSHVADSLLGAKHQVTALDNVSTGSRDNVAHLFDNPAFSLVEGSIMDAGLVSYHEFACSRQTLSWMQATGIPSDGELQIVERCVGGHNVIVKVWPKGGKCI